MNELTLGIFEVVPKSAYTTGSVNSKDSGCLFSNRSKSRERDMAVGQYQRQRSAQTATELTTGLCIG